MTSTKFQIERVIGFLFCASIASVGCSSRASPHELPPTEQNGKAASLPNRLTESLMAPSALAAYQHLSSASRFALGGSPVQRTESGMSKLAGSQGVFATVLATGMSLGVSNANSPARARPPLSTDPAVHNAAVRSYFVQAGVPVAQILRVSVQAAMHQAGQEGPATTSVHPLLDFYFSTLFRQTPGGVPIVDSYAWARINADNDVVMESVYWPAISAAVVLEAEALSQALGAPSSRAAYLAKLPQDAAGESGKGSVVIHHTSGAWPNGLAAHAVYDVRAGSRTIHYDSSGVARQLAEELPNAWGPVPSTPR